MKKHFSLSPISVALYSAILRGCSRFMGIKRTLCLLVALGMLSSCAPIAGTPSTESEEDSLKVTFVLHCPEAEVATRALDPSQEKQIRDLNLYLFLKNSDIGRHFFSNEQTNQITATLLRGDYDLYVVANTGGNIGELTRAEAQCYAMSISSESDLTGRQVLPMSASGSVVVNQNRVIPVSLTRLTAKVHFSLTIAPEVSSQIAIQSVQVMQVPRTIACFTDNRATSGNLIHYTRQNITGNTFTSLFYVPENRQGVNAAIGDQRAKNAANAPLGATYIYIQGSTYGRQVSYSIYLGGNNTTDFNLERNHHYVVQATIRGINTVDTRVSTVDLTFGAIRNPAYAGETVTSSVTVKCTNAPGRQIYLAAQVVEGGGELTVNGTSWAAGVAMPFCLGDQTRTVPVTYRQDRSGLARIRFTVSDDQGYITYLELTTHYAQSYPVTTSLTESSWSKTAHTPLEVTVRAAQSNNSDGLRVVYELLQGSGTMYYEGARMTDGWEISVGGSTISSGMDFPFRFIPTSVGTVRFRITFTGDRGQSSVVEKTLTGIVPYKVTLTPDFAKVEPAGTVITSDNIYNAYYIKDFTICLLTSADKPLVKPVSVSVTLQYKLGEFKTSVIPTVTTQTKTGVVVIDTGAKSGAADLVTYAASCVGYAPNGASKVIFPGFYMVPKNVSEIGEHREEAVITACKITSPADSSIEYTLLPPVK